MQFETRITARIPRCQCPACGVKTITVPWAGRHSRFPLMFEGFAVALMQHCSSLQAAAKLLRLDWHTVDEIMKQAVQTQLPDADIVYDRFHVSKYLNEAVDQVRRKESQQLSKQGEKTLVGSKFSRLRNPENMSSAQRATIDLLMEAELKTGVAWSIKNGFRKLWDLPSQKHGEWYFWYWSLTVDRSGLAPMIKVKEMLERHRDNLMNWFNHRVSNAVLEGLKSKIQSLKSAARGFHNFESYRTRILFFCGKLNMQIAAVT